MVVDNIDMRADQGYRHEVVGSPEERHQNNVMRKTGFYQISIDEENILASQQHAANSA